jgi:hypothetical protein
MISFGSFFVAATFSKNRAPQIHGVHARALFAADEVVRSRALPA